MVIVVVMVVVMVMVVVVVGVRGALVVMAVGARGFEFEGAVVDADAVEQLLDAVGDGFEVRRVGDDDVCGEGGLGGGDGPDMQVMDISHVVERVDAVSDLVDVEAFRHSVGTHAEAFGEEIPGGNEDDDGYDEANDGVDEVPAGEVDDDAADDDADADEGVGKHVEEGAAGVDVVLLLTAEGPSGESVDEDADGGGPDDERAVDGRGMDDFLDAFDDDGAYGNEEDDGVEERDEDGGFAVAIGEAFGGHRGGEFEGYHGQQEREDVAEVVAGVGE